MSIIKTCLPIVYRDELGRVSVEEGLDMRRISQVWGCVVHTENVVVFLEKVNHLSLSAEEVAAIKIGGVRKLYDSLKLPKLSLQGSERKPHLLKDDVWKAVAEKFAAVQCTMAKMRLCGIAADDLYTGSYISFSSDMVSSPLDPEQKNDDKIHFRFGVVLRNRTRQPSEKGKSGRVMTNENNR